MNQTINCLIINFLLLIFFFIINFLLLFNYFIIINYIIMFKLPKYGTRRRTNYYNSNVKKAYLKDTCPPKFFTNCTVKKLSESFSQTKNIKLICRILVLYTQCYCILYFLYKGEFKLPTYKFDKDGFRYMKDIIIAYMTLPISEYIDIYIPPSININSKTTIINTDHYIITLTDINKTDINKSYEWLKTFMPNTTNSKINESYVENTTVIPETYEGNTIVINKSNSKINNSIKRRNTIIPNNNNPGNGYNLSTLKKNSENSEKYEKTELIEKKSENSEKDKLIERIFYNCNDIYIIRNLKGMLKFSNMLSSILNKKENEILNKKDIKLEMYEKKLIENSKLLNYTNNIISKHNNNKLKTLLENIYNISLEYFNLRKKHNVKMEDIVKLYTTAKNLFDLFDINDNKIEELLNSLPE